MKHHRTRVPVFLFADYILESPKDPKRLVILLHGYGQTGQGIFEKLAPVLPSDAAVLSPNGPFPMPRRTQEGYKVGFSWYFYDPATDQYYMDMEIAVQFLEALLQELRLTELPITLIGFSQGGYLAPFVAQKLVQVDHVIGLGAHFLVDELALPVRYRADAVHGALDDIVLATEAQASHQKLTSSGTLRDAQSAGEFRLLPGTEHEIDEAMQKAVGEMLSRARQA